jgi:hypothetical protein
MEKRQKGKAFMYKTLDNTQCQLAKVYNFVGFRCLMLKLLLVCESFTFSFSF